MLKGALQGVYKYSAFNVQLVKKKLLKVENILHLSLSNFCLPPFALCEHVLFCDISWKWAAVPSNLQVICLWVCDVRWGDITKQALWLKSCCGARGPLGRRVMDWFPVRCLGGAWLPAEVDDRLWASIVILFSIRWVETVWIIAVRGSSSARHWCYHTETLTCPHTSLWL